MGPRDNGGGRVPRPGPDTKDTADQSASAAMVAHGADVIRLETWLLAHGRWAAWEAERSTWAPEWAATRQRLPLPELPPPCTGVCTCWGAPLGGQP
jgi:hypothetical protein